VDNASTDSTAEVAESCRPRNMPLVYIHEPRRGKGYAYNTGMRTARGQVFLFTDDDVRPPANWIEGMCEPILSGRVDALVGGVKIAPHLERPWMEKTHRWWMGSSEYINAEAPEGMIGANMAFSRKVLEKVPGFDTELGPGALGFEDDTLFTWQLVAAGYRLGCAFDVVVEHHFEESRLSRSGFLERSKKAAQSQAYVAYHWEHCVTPLVRLRYIKAVLRLAYLRMKNRRQKKHEEGLPLWEIDGLYGVYYYRQYLFESKRAFNYEKHGLVKLS
jgi:glycosyltransferase involved in cell wall biosynthesis